MNEWMGEGMSEASLPPSSHQQRVGTIVQAEADLHRAATGQRKVQVAYLEALGGLPGGRGMAGLLTESSSLELLQQLRP